MSFPHTLFDTCAQVVPESLEAPEPGKRNRVYEMLKNFTVMLAYSGEESL